MTASEPTGRRRKERIDYAVQIRDDPALAGADADRRRATVALFDLLQTHLSEYGGGRP